MCRWVGRVRWTSFREGDRQQASPMLQPHPRNSITPEDVVVEVVVSPPSGMGLDPTCEAFRTKPAMDKPFVEVGALLSEQRCLCDQRQDVLATQRDVAELRPGVAIWIGRRKCVLAQSEHNQRRVHVGLKAEVAMDVLGELASATDETGRRIKREPRPRPSAALAGKPF